MNEKARKKMRRFAKKCILEANTAIAIVNHNPNFRNVPIDNTIDPERWHIIRIYAQKILKAVEAGSWVDPQWIKAIQTEADRGAKIQSPDENIDLEKLRAFAERRLANARRVIEACDNLTHLDKSDFCFLVPKC